MLRLVAEHGQQVEGAVFGDRARPRRLAGSEKPQADSTQDKAARERAEKGHVQVLPVMHPGRDESAQPAIGAGW